MEPSDPRPDAPAYLGEVEASQLDFHLLAGRPALDLVATIGERWRRRIERLREPADLARWLATTGLTDTRPRVTRADLEAARQLRTAILRATEARRAGRRMPDADVATINAMATRRPLATALTPDGARHPAGPRTAARAFATIAQDAVDLLSEVEPDRIRECAAEDCSLLFVDASRPGRRRWCSMSGCGNRAKARAHRHRASRDQRRGP